MQNLDGEYNEIKYSETDIQTKIKSGLKSFYFMINFFVIERNEEITSNKCCKSKHCCILYKLTIYLGIEL